MVYDTHTLILNHAQSRPSSETNPRYFKHLLEVLSAEDIKLQGRNDVHQIALDGLVVVKTRLLRNLIHATGEHHRRRDDASEEYSQFR